MMAYNTPAIPAFLRFLSRNAKENRPKPLIYMACGTEDALLPDSRKTRDMLKKDGFDVTYAEAPGGHTWEFWDKQIEIALLDWTKRD